MKKIGFSVDYSNICKDYNTVYLDRDNKDPATSKCMKKVLEWSSKLITDFLSNFDYTIYNASSGVIASVDDISSKRFLFYSLEKEIMLQGYIVAKEHIEYSSLKLWEQSANDTILIQNDEDGSCLYFYFNEGSKEGEWLHESLKNFTLDEVPFEVR